MTGREIEAVARLLRVRNAVDRELAALIDRPATPEDLGEWIAATLFDIELHDPASGPGPDGVFAGGALAGRSVDIRWYMNRETTVDLAPADRPDFCLVMTGPLSESATAPGAVRPLCVDEVHLFDVAALVASLTERGAAVGPASEVRKQEWTAAQIYPAAAEHFPLSTEQLRALALLRA